MIYLELLFGFLKVGLFSFGGAYAAIPLIRDVVLSYGWMEEDMLSYMIAVSESTPGPLMVNLATYVGSAQGGLLGAVIATAAVVLPAFAIIIILTALLKKAMKNRYVNAFVEGLKPCVMGIILAVGAAFILNNCVLKEGFDLRSTLLTAALALVYFGPRLFLKKKLSPILLIGISAVAGIFVFA